MSNKVFFVEYHTGNPKSDLWHTLWGPFETEEEAINRAEFYMKERRPSPECKARVVEHIKRVCYVADDTGEASKDNGAQS